MCFASSCAHTHAWRLCMFILTDWASWVAYGIVFNALTTLVLQVSGLIAGFDLFTNSSFAVTFLLFFLFGVAMMSMALAVSTLITRAKTAQTVGYLLIAIGFVMQSILCSAYGSLIDLLFSSSLASWVVVVRWVLTFYPAFYMSKGFYDISSRSSPEISVAAGKVTEGPGFAWGDLFLTRHLKFFNFDITVPPTVQVFYYLAANAVLYAALAFYLDAVLPGSHGSPRHPLLCLRRPCAALCCCGRRGSRSRGYRGEGGDDDDDDDNDDDWADWAGPRPAGNSHRKRSRRRNKLSCRDEGVAEERQRAAMSPAPAGVAVRLHKLKKVYWRNRLACRGKDVRAVNGLDLTIQQGEIFALLGHNGCVRVCVSVVPWPDSHPLHTCCVARFQSWQNDDTVSAHR